MPDFLILVSTLGGLGSGPSVIVGPGDGAVLTLADPGGRRPDRQRLTSP
jgi:hypothetical protein